MRFVTLILVLLLALAGCNSTPPSPALPTVAPTAVPSAPPTAEPTLDPTAVIIAAVQAGAQPQRTSFASPDRQWQVELTQYGCVPTGDGGEHAYETLSLARSGGVDPVVLDSQLISCGGLGAYGLQGLFWSSNARFFYYTTAREGTSDGCGFWLRPFKRLDVTFRAVLDLGGGLRSPDGGRLATWQDGQLALWGTEQGELGRRPLIEPTGSLSALAWAPDGQALAYLQAPSPCDPGAAGNSIVVRVDAASLNQTVLFDAAMPRLTNLTWETPATLSLFDAQNDAWRLDAQTGALTAGALPSTPVSTNSPTPADTPTPLPTDTPSPTSTATPTPTATVKPTAVPTATAAPIPSIEVIVDDGGSGFRYSGAWYAGDGGRSFEGGCHWAPPGYGNIAYINPNLPQAGSYDIYAWGCGDPNHDQVWQTTIMVYSYGSGFVYAVPQASVNLKEDAGRWVPLGTYYMQTNSTLSVGGQYWGNVTVDAFRFVYRTPKQVFITPEPPPTPYPWTNHPPSPAEQLTSGDLALRLGLVQRFYQATPLQHFDEVSFDDCQAFPRPGCSGARAGWEAQIEYQGRQRFTATYRLSKDLAHVSLDAPAPLRDRQTVFLCGSKDARELCVHRYPDQSWHLITRNTADGSGSSMAMSGEQAATLMALVDKYSTLGVGISRIATADGWTLRLYGLGTRSALDADDQTRLLQLGAQLTAQAIP